MKICSTENEYIDAIFQAAQKACKRYGYLPSVLIAQSCLENGFGILDYMDNPQITLLLEANNMVGIKSSLLNDSWNNYTVWQGESITKRTPEEYNGKMVTITDDFRKYDNIERSFCDFLLFLKFGSNYGPGGVPKYGDAVLSIKDPEKLIKTVAGRGYATGSTYPTSVMRILNKHNLTKYDYLDNVEPSMIVPDSLKAKYGITTTATKTETPKKTNIKKLAKPRFVDNRDASHYQVPKWRNRSDVKYIVVHYLGVVGQNFELWNNGYGATFTIAWNGDVYWTADYTSVTWQCGGSIQGESNDGDGVAPHRFYGKCTNYNSVSIETCVKRTDGKYEGDDNDDKWYFTEASQESLVWAVSKMMDDLNIPIDRVIRHFDVTGKICPNPYVRENGRNGNWTWNQFKANLAQYRKNGTITIPDGSTSTSTPTTSTSTLLRKGSEGTAVKTMQKMLVACGYSIGSTGIDGDFGSATEKALRAFQSDHKIGVDGIYGPASKAALEGAYKATQTNIEQAEIWINEVAKVAETARKQKWTYGNSTSDVPCADKKISCDRLVARALHNLGCASQPKGGVTCGNIGTYLPKFGFTKVTKKSEIKPGAVVAVRKIGTKNINHVFVVKSYNASNDTCVKYDTGSQSRIDTAQPFKNVKLVEWNDREFVCAWNVPKKLTTSPSTSGQTVKFTLNGLDYSPVFNPVYYSNKYADLFKAFGTDAAKLWDHFKTYGMKEARQASSNFNVEKYKANYQDLQKAFGNNWPLYYKHYIEFGKKEGRKA